MPKNQLYQLELYGLAYHGYHGVFPRERQQGQAFFVDVKMTYEPGSLQDKLEDALDYGTVERVIAQVMEGPPVKLLETLLDRLATALLDKFPNLLAAEIAIHKPRAPLAGNAADVVARRKVQRVVKAYLGLGSNLGDRLENLRRAVSLLGAQEGILPVAVSPLYETAPLDVLNQPPFLNSVIEIETTRTPSDLLSVCKQVEFAAGRRPGLRRGPRVLDVDILVYGHFQLDKPFLQIPHAQLAGRAFALQPLYDLNPNLEIPGRGPVDRLLAGVSDQKITRLAGPEWTWSEVPV